MTTPPLNTNEHSELQANENNHNDERFLAINNGYNRTKIQLDNRNIIHAVTENAEALSQRKIISRTLTNSHPLMPAKSPTGSDTEQYSGLWNNFPDVVPLNEHLPQMHSNSGQQQRDMVNNETMYVRPKDTKVNLIRSQSPDLLSSGSEADVSQYFATVQPNSKSAALIATANVSGDKKKTVLTSNMIMREEISSVDSISNRSFEIEPNLASLSPSSSVIAGLGVDDDDDDDNDDVDVDDANVDDDHYDSEGPEFLPDNDDDLDDFDFAPNLPAREDLPQYSANDERRESRSWQKITLPDGRVREIDMRVIEPYKRVLSHGGYLNAGGQNAIVIFCACHLPDKSRTDYNYVMDNLFLYVLKTLEQLVTDDYVLIYLHGGSSRRNVPPFPWLKRCYQMLDRRLRKSLKHMYLVHPSFWMKSVVWMIRPFVSVKFWRKVIYVKSLEELYTLVTVEKAAIPEKVKQYDAKHH